MLIRNVSFVCVLLGLAAGVVGQDVPTSLICRSNAKAWRDYSFREKRWVGAASQPFGAATVSRRVKGHPLREKLFSKLDTDEPTVRSITPATDDAPEVSDEFAATVALRTPTWLFLTWSNDVNKLWLAVIDLEESKATVTLTFRGVTSVGGEVETLDCR